MNNSQIFYGICGLFFGFWGKSEFYLVEMGINLSIALFINENLEFVSVLINKNKKKKEKTL